jgi:hypothetical protein
LSIIRWRNGNFGATLRRTFFHPGSSEYAIAYTTAH